MSDAQEQQPQHRARLGAELRRLRERAGLSRDQLSGILHISKSTLLRIEAGGTKGGAPASWETVKAWAQACAAADPDLDYLRTLTDFTLDTRPPYHERGTWADVQEGVRRDEADAMTMRNFANWGVPGLLQTPQYAHDVMRLADLQDAGGIDEAVPVRMSRQVILSDARRNLQFLVAEEALRSRPGPLPALRAQLAYLVTVVTWPAVTFRVLPLAAEERALKLCPFVIFEDRLSGGTPWVSVEMAHAEAPVREPAGIALYRTLFDRMWEAALRDEDAVEFVRQVAASLS